MAIDDTDSRIEILSKEIDNLLAQPLDDDARKKLSGVVSQATARLESPVDAIWKIIMSPHAPAALMIMIPMGVVQELAKADRPMTAKELCTSCGGEEILIGLISQRALWRTCHGYMAKTNYKNVNGPPGPFQDCDQDDGGMFQHLMKNPVMMDNFNKFMSGATATRPLWHKIFAVEDILLADAKKDNPEAVLLVDVGGGEGHDVASFHIAFPDAPGKLVLQDQPFVIDNIKDLDSVIIRQKHDFFTAQPVCGARAYYFRYILHDWHDDACISILRQTAAAMTRGYSKLLIFEWILPSRGVPLYPALLDINMMALLNGIERTEAQWTALLVKGGFKVIQFHKNGEDAEGLIEAELA